MLYRSIWVNQKSMPSCTYQHSSYRMHRTFYAVQVPWLPVLHSTLCCTVLAHFDTHLWDFCQCLLFTSIASLITLSNGISIGRFYWMLYNMLYNLLVSNFTMRTPPMDERTNKHNMLPHPNISTCQDVGMWQNVHPLVANCCTASWQHVVCVRSFVRSWVMLCSSVCVVEFDTMPVSGTNCLSGAVFK